MTAEALKALPSAGAVKPLLGPLWAAVQPDGLSLVLSVPRLDPKPMQLSYIGLVRGAIAGAMPLARDVA